MELSQQYQRVSRLLSHSVKQRVRRMAPLYVQRAHHLHDTHSLYLAALAVLEPKFPSSSVEESNVLAFYLLGLVVAAEGDWAGKLDTTNEKIEMANKLDTMNEMSEMASLRLQMFMDRRSKLFSTLSNILKKSASTSETITQNIK